MSVYDNGDGAGCANCVIGKTSQFSGQFCPSCARLLAEEAYKLVQLTDLQPSDPEANTESSKAQDHTHNNISRELKDEK